MEVSEAKQKRTELEFEIKGLISWFEVETGLVVKSIDIYSSTTIGGAGAIGLVTVNTEL